MKKIISIALAAVLTLCVFTGGRGNVAEGTTLATTLPAPRPTTAPTTAPTTRPTTAPTTAPTEATTSPSTDMTMPDMEDMVPGPEDTIDPSNGANQDTGARRRNMR